jgi:hypothetical protein
VMEIKEGRMNAHSPCHRGEQLSGFAKWSLLRKLRDEEKMAGLLCRATVTLEMRVM